MSLYQLRLLYRDIDTIERLLQVFGTDSDTLDQDQPRQEKKNLLRKLAALETPIQTPNADSPILETFNLGELVRLKADPAKTGAIVGVLQAIRKTVIKSSMTVPHRPITNPNEPAASTAARITVSSEALHAAPFS